MNLLIPTNLQSSSTETIVNFSPVILFFTSKVALFGFFFYILKEKYKNDSF